jgi:dipeptidyl aminopeptidase/acylaminoacyl peptidase
VTADLVVVPGMGHALAEEPGIAPAPQLAAAAEVDRLAVGWFARHLG